MGVAERNQSRIRVVICWDMLSGYIASCWRALAARPEIELSVIAVHAIKGANIAFNNEITAGLDVTLVTRDELNAGKTAELAAAKRPDVVVVCGWGLPGMRMVPEHPDLAHAKFMMTMDTPIAQAWRPMMRQRMGRFARRAYFAKIDRVAVAGERAWQLARVLGFQEDQIVRGCYAIDWPRFEPIAAERRSAMARGGATQTAWPRRFLFMARYVPDKAIDVLVEAYRAYRDQVRDPWPLVCCGQGEEGALLRGVEGIEDAGFVQPADQPARLRDSGCFLMPSRYEPWGVALAEAAAAGLPLIATEAVGASVELLHDRFNGRKIATDDWRALAEALIWMHERSDAELVAMGEHSRGLGAAFAAEVLAARWAGVFGELVG